MAPTESRASTALRGRGASPGGGGADELLDQIVFRWDAMNAGGNTGFGPVAWSGGGIDVDELFHVAGPMLRASGEEVRPALIRLQSETEAMLIRRIPWTDPGGGASTVCHALVGPAGLLNPMTCLGLHAWRWRGSRLDLGRVRGEALDRIPESVLVESSDDGLRALDADLARVEIELGGAVAELLRHPGSRFMFLDERADTALPVLWGLYGLLGDSFARRWSFATHDTAESTHLNFVFVGRWAGAAGPNTDRHRSDPRERLGDEADSVATRLVAHHLRGVAAGDGDYAVCAHLAGARRHRPDASLLACARAALTALDRERRRGPRPGDRSADLPGDRPGDRPGPAPADPPVRLGDAELLDALRDPGLSYADTKVLVHKAARRFPGWTPAQQCALRDLVIDEEYFVPRPFAEERIPAAQRGADAAALHDWAVGPLLDHRSDTDAADRLGALLLRFAARTEPEGRAVLREIVALEHPGLPERVWRDLVRAAIPPAVYATPGPVRPQTPPKPQPQPKPQTSPRQQSHPKPQPHPEPQAHPKPAAPPTRTTAPVRTAAPHAKDGWLAFAFLGAALVLLVTLVVVVIAAS
ncbi:hypothetical protein [Streptomyces sp. NPDC051909]|uniref:hypothetical protein n=1 Tax=Streptomyces sp. NPDC051909 TaxID=3154944 RepID=UPI00342BC635